MKTYLVRGVPASIQRDGWWLNAPAGEGQRGESQSTQSPMPARLALLVPLIALGDVLVWQVSPGLSLAVFGAALILAALWVAGSRISGRRQALVLGGSLLSLLPLVELVQPLSFVIAVLGISAMLALLAGIRPAELVPAMLRLWPMGARQTFVDAGQVVPGKGAGDWNDIISRAMLHWLMPLGLGLIFSALLLEANPIAARWAGQLWSMDLAAPDLARIGFWFCLVPLAWTALGVTRMQERLRAPAARASRMGPARQGLINPHSMIRALVIFNAVFALQSLMDAVYLYGGVGLPEGITYAQYAHRGAYPLVVTALLAGGFALLTRRWVRGNALLRGLLMIWVAQNVALVVSSLVRLELYVGVYGLTHLRLAAAIWMGLVAAGLALILWQVWKCRDNAWLMLRGGALAAAVLYGCAWVSFDATIAQYNLSHEVISDNAYLCTLGEAAEPVIASHDRENDVTTCIFYYHSAQAPRDWREWGFRNWRARTSLAAIKAEVQP